MKTELEPVGINTYNIDRLAFDERKYFTIDFFTDNLSEYFSFVTDFDRSRISPMMRFDQPVDGWGNKYKESVQTVRYVFVTPNILVRHFTVIEGDDLE